MTISIHHHCKRYYCFEGSVDCVPGVGQVDEVGGVVQRINIQILRLQRLAFLCNR